MLKTHQFSNQNHIQTHSLLIVYLPNSILVVQGHLSMKYLFGKLCSSFVWTQAVKVVSWLLDSAALLKFVIL